MKPETMRIGKLEPEYQEAFIDYSQDPSPRHASSLLKAVRPSIQKGLRAYGGASPSPLLESHARRIALQAARNYDPNQATLGTHIINHLRGLQRISHKQQQIIPVPERHRLEANYLLGKEREFEDEYGREPTTEELADYSKVGVRRIEQVRRFRPAIAGGAMRERPGTGGETIGYSPAVKGGDRIWVEAVYGDLNPVNKLIMEHTLGMGGKEVLSNRDLAARLNLSPGAVSQRKKFIQYLLDQRHLSPFDR